MKHSIDSERARRAISDFIESLGYDKDCEELRDTPARVVDAYLNDLVVGEQVDVAKLVTNGLVPSTSRSLVVVSDIAVSTLCPHHLLPALGQATVAYLPGNSLLGLGTMAALVNALGRRLTLQEQLTEEVVKVLMTIAGAKGAYCAISLEHACLRLRGQRQSSAVVSTSCVEGSLREPTQFLELTALLRGKS